MIYVKRKQPFNSCVGWNYHWSNHYLLLHWNIFFLYICIHIHGPIGSKQLSIETWKQTFLFITYSISRLCKLNTCTYYSWPHFGHKWVTPLNFYCVVSIRYIWSTDQLLNMLTIDVNTSMFICPRCYIEIYLLISKVVIICSVSSFKVVSVLYTCLSGWM